MTRAARDAERPEELVTLVELHDPVTAEMAADLLRQSGVPVVMSGLHHNSLLGAVGSVIRIVLRVPRGDRDHAEELLAAHWDPDAAELVDDPATPPELWVRDDPERPRRPPPEGHGGPYRAPPVVGAPAPRSATRAALFALFPTFGSGHAYAGRRRRGLALAAVQTLSLLLVSAGVDGALVGVPAAVVADLFGAVRAVRRGQAPDTTR